MHEKFVRKFPLAINQTKFTQRPSKINVKTNSLVIFAFPFSLAGVRIFIPRYRERIRLIRSTCPNGNVFQRFNFVRISRFVRSFIDRDGTNVWRNNEDRNDFSNPICFRVGENVTRVSYNYELRAKQQRKQTEVFTKFITRGARSTIFVKRIK